MKQLDTLSVLPPEQHTPDSLLGARYEFEDTKAPFRVVEVFPGTHEYDEFVALRRNYIQSMGWEQEGDEVDAYDDPEKFPDSHNLVVYGRFGEDQQERQFLGMRVTRVEDIFSSKSWGMIPEDIQQSIIKNPEFERLKIAAEAGQLWDVTRLVSDVNMVAEGLIDFEQVKDGLVMMTTVASKKIVGDHPIDRKMAWFFVTTPLVKFMLETVKIQFATLGEGYFNSKDEYPSAVCVSSPKDTFAYVAEQLNNGTSPEDRVLLPGWIEAGAALGALARQANSI